MKFKKTIILASCVLIAAMGITLTGCDLDIKGIVDEKNSVVNDESSHNTDYANSSDTSTENNSTDNESSSDTNIENPNSGTWVLTETKYFVYKDGEEQYVSKQNEYYKHRCYFRGVTDDNFIKFQVSGGFYDPSDSKNNRTCDAYHLCSIPDTSYPAGGLVTLTAKNYEENVIGWGHGGSSSIGINYELKEADGKKEDPFVHPCGMWGLDFYSADGEKGRIDMGKSNTFTANMPEEAEIGDRIAIIFQGSTAYDSWSDEPQNDYGGTVWYAWIYTFTK